MRPKAAPLAVAPFQTSSSRRVLTSADGGQMRVGIDALIAALERCGGLAPLDARKGSAVDASAELDIAGERAKAQRPQPMRK